MPRRTVKTTPPPAPNVLVLPPAAMRNPVQRALAKRASSGAAGKHEKSASAQRSADKRALDKSLLALKRV